MAKITAHLDSKEFNQPARHGFKEEEYPRTLIDSDLKPMGEDIEIIRAEFNKPVIILSGYRSRAYNNKIGGAKKSQHVLGRAADIQVKGVKAALVHDVILRLYREGKLKRIRGLGKYPTFTHIDVRLDAEGKVPKRLARWEGSRVES